MTSSPRFTVLLPTHNRVDVLPFCIQSVLDQSETDFELLIVADGCTDETPAMVASFDDPRIRFHDLPKAPFFGYANRNLAMRTARGRFVAYAPHDDLLFPDHLAQLGARLEDSRAALAYSLPVWVSSDGVAVPLSSNLNFADEILRFQKSGNTLPAVVMAHRRDVFDAVGGWPENVPAAADWVLWRRILDSSDGRLAYLSTPTSLHFSAQWRAARDANFSPLTEALQIADEEKWWPSILRHEPKAGHPEQEPYAQAMVRGGMEWCNSVRHATTAVLNRLAFDALCFGRPGLKQAQATAAEAQARAAADAAQVSARDADLQAMTERVVAQRSEVAMLSATIDALTREREEADRCWGERCDDLQHRLVEAEQSRRLLLASRSWRVSAPLRWLKTRVSS